MSFSIVGPIPDTITKTKKSVSEFIEQLSEVNNQLLIGKKEIDLEARQRAFLAGANQRAALLKDITFFKDPSIASLISMLSSLNSFELCNPFSFALNQAFPPDSPVGEKFAQVQGDIKGVFELLRNFSLVPGVDEIDNVVIDEPIQISRDNRFTFPLPPLRQNKPYPISIDTIMTFSTVEPPAASMTGKITKIPETITDKATGRSFVLGSYTFEIDIDTASTTIPPVGKDQKPLLFEKFSVEYQKTPSADILEISSDLATIAEEFREIGFQDILNDLNSIPPFFPGIGKIQEKAQKLQNFFDKLGRPAAQIGDEIDDASQFLAGGLSSREILEGSRIVAEFQRRIQPILNFENTLTTGFKDTVENINKLLRGVIPYEELSKFVTFLTNFARIVQGVVSILLVLLKTINKIVKIITTILKVFNVIIKIVKAVLKIMPLMFLTAGIVEVVQEKLSEAQGALKIAISYLEKISGHLEIVIAELEFLKLALGKVIEEGANLAAKLASCKSMKGNGLETGMIKMVEQIRGSLRGLTGALPGEDYYPNRPNGPGRGLSEDSFQPGTNSHVTLPNGEIMFVNDSIIGFDEFGNLIFFGNLVSLSTGIAFNDTLGQSFRNRNLTYYTFDKFRNSQKDMLSTADRIAHERNNRIKEIDPSDRFGNFAERYKGYTIKIQEEIEDNVNAQTATRRRGIAFDSVEKIVVSTDLTFSVNLGQIVNEVKFLIDRLISEGIIGINTSDAQANEPSDDDVINVAEGAGANKLAIANLRAEKNNKIAASLPDKPGKPTKSRIGNDPFESNVDGKIATRGKTDGGSPNISLDAGAIAEAGIDAFVKANPELNNLANNLTSINRATTSQLSNLLKQPGIEDLTEEELIEKLKGDVLSGLDPNPEKVEEVKEKTRIWYEGIRAKARVDFNQLAASQAQVSRPKGGRPVTSGKPKPEFEPFVTKIELREIPRWIKLLRRRKYTQAEIDGGLSGEGIRDKYEIKVNEDGKIDIRKKLAFKEDNFKGRRRKT